MHNVINNLMSQYYFVIIKLFNRIEILYNMLFKRIYWNLTPIE